MKIEVHIDQKCMVEITYRPELPTSYAEQLAAFVAAVRDGGPVLTDPADSVATMTAIDAMYTAAGLEPRATTR